MVDVQAVIDHLKQISHLFQKNNDTWRSRAFSRVAAELESRPELLVIENRKLVTKIPGVGKAIKDVIEQFVAEGTSRKIEKLKAMFPQEEVERFDSRTCKRIVSKLLRPLTEAGVDWGYAGSIRRGSKTCKDVDVVVCLKTKNKERMLIEKVLKENGLEADVRNGQEKVGVSIPIKSQGRSFTLDLNFTTAESRGAMYLYFTGPKSFNIKQRSAAKRRGLRLNQKGLFDGDKMIAGRTEEEIFEALGWPYKTPDQRA